MGGCSRSNVGLGCLLATVGVLTLIAGVPSCGTAPTAFLINGPGGAGNVLPTLEFLEPIEDLTRGQGDPFLIRWTDTDPDDNAQITFALVSTETNSVIPLVEGIAENDQVGPDSHTVSTRLIPIGSYNILAVIDDGTNAPVAIFASTAGTNTQRVVLRIVGEGEGQQTEPPTVAVSEPSFDLSVTQDDILDVVVQPTLLNPADTPFDRDSDVTLFILLDLDQDPNNDDPANPDPSQIVVLQVRAIAIGEAGVITIPITIDLALVPPRADGEPYFIRATVDDGTNPRVHAYAVGRISIVRLAEGVVDLFDIGRRVSGVRFQGFSPGANLGSTITTVTDFDADGIDDFAMVAQFGNPQNVGPVGEAYLVYGQDQTRFGGTISVNSISNTVSGVIFQAPPVRSQLIQHPNARTDGITDMSFVRDLSGDGRPELLFGLPHVHGAFDGTDWDPADEDPGSSFCYPDPLVNNLTDRLTGITDEGFYAGGMAVVVNSQNRDNNPRPATVAPRLETTAISLELAGQPGRILGPGGPNISGNILPRADNEGVPSATGSGEPDEAGRIAGARFIAGGFDFRTGFELAGLEPPREGLFGHRVRSLGDLNADDAPEIIVSSPRNERYLTDLVENLTGFFSPHLESTIYSGSITIFPGNNYNSTLWRDENDEGGASTIPALDQWRFPPFGSCDQNPPTARHLLIPADAFEIFAEHIDDMLGDGQSAGDVNQDGLDDILCGAPLNDRSNALPDTGSTYVIFGRSVFGEIQLKTASDAQLRPPMIRIRGVQRGDQIGWTQTAGLDVNGDLAGDVFIASPRTDFAGVTRSTCGVDFNGNGTVDQNDFVAGSFNDCENVFGDEVFASDACSAFDYDMDGDIDDDDRCVFCCLSDTCEPADDCVNGTDENACCATLVDNGFVGIIFGGRFRDGDRTIAQIGTSDLPGAVFYGGSAGDRAGVDVSSAGDFNQDGFGDILIAVPGETRQDSAGRDRRGVVYLIFGGTHLQRDMPPSGWNLSDPTFGVGSDSLPGIIFLSPFVTGRPNEAAPTTVALIGDINNDGFDDIGIGNPRADFIDLSFPQGPDAPGDDPAAGRRTDAGDVYIIYGNNFGANRGAP